MSCVPADSPDSPPLVKRGRKPKVERKKSIGVSLSQSALDALRAFADLRDDNSASAWIEDMIHAAVLRSQEHLKNISEHSKNIL